MHQSLVELSNLLARKVVEEESTKQVRRKRTHHGPLLVEDWKKRWCDKDTKRMLDLLRMFGSLTES